jgi:hypothetical protein
MSMMYDVGIGVSQPLSVRGGVHALEKIFEKLGSAPEVLVDTSERGMVGSWDVSLLLPTCTCQDHG